MLDHRSELLGIRFRSFRQFLALGTPCGVFVGLMTLWSCFLLGLSFCCRSYGIDSSFAYLLLFLLVTPAQILHAFYSILLGVSQGSGCLLKSWALADVEERLVFFGLLLCRFLRNLWWLFINRWKSLICKYRVRSNRLGVGNLFIDLHFGVIPLRWLNTWVLSHLIFIEVQLGLQRLNLLVQGVGMGKVASRCLLELWIHTPDNFEHVQGVLAQWRQCPRYEGNHLLQVR